MANKPNQKLRMLYVLKLFFEETDTENGLTTQQIIDELANLGLEAERKRFRALQVKASVICFIVASRFPVA